MHGAIDRVILSLRRIWRAALQLPPLPIRCTQDASQPQHDAVMDAEFFKLSHHTWNLLLDANQNWVDDLWSDFVL
jgi:hypothetical protein